MLCTTAIKDDESQANSVFFSVAGKLKNIIWFVILYEGSPAVATTWPWP